jgi:hypothetical protein
MPCPSRSIAGRLMQGWVLVVGCLAFPYVACGQGVVINEIMYHPYHAGNQPEDAAAEFVEVFNAGSQTVDLSGWRFTKGIQYTFPKGTMLKGASYLVVASDVARFRQLHPDVPDAVGGWSGRLDNSGENLELVDAGGAQVVRVAYSDEGEWALRELGPVDHDHRGWQWSDATDGGCWSLELINPVLPSQYGQNWAASRTGGGTPGRANSVAASDVAPLILDVTHSPVIPGPKDPVHVTARLVDERSTGLRAFLYYRVDGQPSFARRAMADDGAHGDGEPNDGIYGVEIPAQPDRAIVEFYVEAADGGGRVRTWPAPSSVDGVPRQVTNALYLVDGSVDPQTPWVPGGQPVYDLVMTEQERSELAYIGSRMDGEEDSDAGMNGTFISIGQAGVDLRYNVEIRNRGHGTRSGPPNNYHVHFPHDRRWQKTSAINFNCRYTHAQIMGCALFHGAGIAAPDAVPVQVRVNGENLAYPASPMYGVYVGLEAFDADFAAGHFPDDPDGNLYMCFRTDGGPEAELLYEGDNPDAYRDRYFKASREARQDWSDLTHMLNVLNNAPDGTYLAEVSKVINVPQWLRYIALDSLLVNQETGLNMGIGDDFFLYRGAVDTRFVLIPHDLDTILGEGSGPGRIDQSVFSIINGVPGYDGVAGLKRFLTHPEVAALYYQAFADLMGEFYNPETLDPLFESVLGGFTPKTRIDAMKQFVRQRIAAVVAQIPQEFMNRRAQGETRSGSPHYGVGLP